MRWRLLQIFSKLFAAIPEISPTFPFHDNGVFMYNTQWFRLLSMSIIKQFLSLIVFHNKIIGPMSLSRKTLNSERQKDKIIQVFIVLINYIFHHRLFERDLKISFHYGVVL